MPVGLPDRAAVSGERRSAVASGRLQRVRDVSRPPDVEMETLRGFALHSAPATRPASPALRAASPNLPALWLRQAKPACAYASLRSEQLLTPALGTHPSPCAPSESCRGLALGTFAYGSCPGSCAFIRGCKLGARAGWGRLRGGIGERRERPRSRASEPGQGPASSIRVGSGGLCPTIPVAGGHGNPSRVPIKTLVA